MRLSVPLAFGVAMWAAAAQAQVTAPVTITPMAPASPERAQAGMKNAASVGAVSDERNPSVGTGPTQEPPEAGTPHRRKGLRVRFEEANTTHDGRLTPEQAQASWPMVAKHFAEIDKDKHGYVTIDDIRLYRREHRRHNGTAGMGTTGAESSRAGSSVGGKPRAGESDAEQ